MDSIWRESARVSECESRDMSERRCTYAISRIDEMKITSLHHEARYDTMKALALVVELRPALTRGERAKVLGRLGYQRALELDHDASDLHIIDRDIEEAPCLLGDGWRRMLGVDVAVGVARHHGGARSSAWRNESDRLRQEHRDHREGQHHGHRSCSGSDNVFLPWSMWHRWCRQCMDRHRVS